MASELSILRTRKSVEESLDEAFASREPVFLDVVTESLLTELPPVYSWQKAAEKKKELAVSSL